MGSMYIGGAAQDLLTFASCISKPKFRRMVTVPYCSLTHGLLCSPFWVCNGFVVRDYNILPDKELHRRSWVSPKRQTLRLMRP